MALISWCKIFLCVSSITFICMALRGVVCCLVSGSCWCMGMSCCHPIRPVSDVFTGERALWLKYLTWILQFHCSWTFEIARVQRSPMSSDFDMNGDRNEMFRESYDLHQVKAHDRPFRVSPSPLHSSTHQRDGNQVCLWNGRWRWSTNWWRRRWASRGCPSPSASSHHPPTWCWPSSTGRASAPCPPPPTPPLLIPTTSAGDTAARGVVVGSADSVARTADTWPITSRGQYAVVDENKGAAADAVAARGRHGYRWICPLACCRGLSFSSLLPRTMLYLRQLSAINAAP